MGDCEGGTWPSGFYPNGLLPDGVVSVTRGLDQERWSQAEERTAELIACIQPNQPSEDRRNAVARYVKCLIMKCFPCQVFTFGSVPLKTYLPDGDIDLTAFSNDQNLKGNWAKEVLEILESEEKIEDAEFHVKEVQYINAEVKIIKCLVENIVVDISINQLGGLCTLCFLEEVDNLINHNHLFKRSIILIKAWCYYESRILGAHHGLISTFALETLVLYIFHLYNNSFAGPLEVLYRFLEFFSKFDWDNFCVSLWGPVPISSLPNMAVDPPRNDVEDLSLSKLVYACISAYTVLPHGQENQEQPFILKHFNIIDPLRMNNNLGRSVNKGNFFRIRSAFAFGAQRLARLLECPKENLIAELNQFFMNTWDRHGKGHRPDAPSPDLYGLRSGNLNKMPDSFRNDLNSTRDEATEKSASYEFGTMVNCPLHRPLSVSSQHGKNSLIWMSRPSNVLADSCIENLKAYTNTINSVSSNQKHHDLQNVCSNENTQADRGGNSRSYSLRNVHVRCQFARTHSSPELTDTSSEVSFRGRSSVSESGNGKAALTKSDNSRRRNLYPEVSDNHIAKFPTEDHPSSRWSSSHQSFDSAVNLCSASNCYYDDSCMGFMEKDCHHVAETIQMHQEEQDFVNMTASRCNINGQVQMQVNLTSAPPLVPIPPSLLASLGYAQKNLAGSTPTKIPAYESPWISSMHYSQGLFPLPVSQYYQGIGVTSNQEEMAKLVDNNLISKELNEEDGNHSSQLKQNLHSLRGYDCNNRSFQALQLENVQQFASGFNSSRVNNIDSYSLKDHRLVMENRGLVGEIYGNNSTCEQIWETDVNFGASSRFLSSQAIPPRTRSSSENFWDGSPSRSSKSTLDKHWRKSVSSTDPSTSEELAENGWRYEGASVDAVSWRLDEDRRECIPLSTVGSNVVESSVSGSAASSHVQTHQIPAHEPALVNGSNSILPVTSVLVGSESQHITSKNLGVSPFSLYPMWAGVPAETGSSSVSANNYGDEEFDNCQRGQSNHSLDSTESLDQSEVFNTCNSMKDVASEEPYEQHKTDILNSDYIGHWQNLQYGRFCQNAGLYGPLLCNGSVVVPPMYLQRHFLSDDAGRPPPANLNLFTQLMGYGPSFISVSPLQPDTSQPVGLYEHCGDEMPEYRSGTGTYLPNHKNFFRGQQYSKTRNHRTRYGCDRKNHVGEREGNWNTNSKPRFAGRGQGRNLVEKPNKRMDRVTVSNSQSDKSWDPSEHDCLPSYHSHNGSSSVSNSMNHSSSNVASAMYPFPVVNPSGVSPSGTAVPSLVMLYPYDQKMGYGSPAEQLEFGSLGAVHLSGIDDASHVDEQHSIQDDSELSSPDQPSSPQLQRRA